MGGDIPRWDRLVQEEHLFSFKTFWESITTSKIKLAAADMTTSETKFKEVKSQLLYFKSEDWDCCSIIHFPPFLICPVRQSRECNLCSDPPLQKSRQQRNPSAQVVLSMAKPPKSMSQTRGIWQVPGSAGLASGLHLSPATPVPTGTPLLVPENWKRHHHKVPLGT